MITQKTEREKDIKRMEIQQCIDELADLKRTVKRVRTFINAEAQREKDC